jgi:hypothetical protein
MPHQAERAERAAALRLHGEPHVLERGEVLEQVVLLERAGDAEMADRLRRQSPDGTAAQADIARIRGELAADEVHVARHRERAEGLRQVDRREEAHVFLHRSPITASAAP